MISWRLFGVGFAPRKPVPLQVAQGRRHIQEKHAGIPGKKKFLCY
tara:strand:+ start:168 stop:302 length:135 start_codon:yes stop_codon:yes gene_type:complete